MAVAGRVDQNHRWFGMALEAVIRMRGPRRLRRKRRTLPRDALSGRESLGATLRTSREALADAARDTPGWLVLSSFLMVVQACLPGAQVVLLKNVVEALSREDAEPSRTWGSLLGLTVVVGLMYPLGQVSLAADQRMGLRLRLRYRTDLARGRRA
jgi:ATP-binding cassette, subfamily B, bacterial